MYKRLITIPRERYDMVYVQNEYGKYLDAYIPHTGYRLFSVCATYARQLKPSEYYVIARNAREARELFKKRHGDILSYISYIRVLNPEQQEFVLNNYNEHPSIII